MRVTDTLAFLAGGWRLSRTLTDRRSGITGSFTGTATFAAPAGAAPGGRAVLSSRELSSRELSPRQLSYREEGILRFGEHCGPAERSLTWLAADGGAAELRFADGRPFCLVNLGTGGWDAGHPCNADHYLISYRVLGPDQFEERWQVRGPGKDYQAAALLTRAPRASAGR